jgi:hypothetical protein
VSTVGNWLHACWRRCRARTARSAYTRGVLLAAPVSRCLRQRSAVALKPVTACLGTGLTNVGASLGKGTPATLAAPLSLPSATLAAPRWCRASMGSESDGVLRLVAVGVGEHGRHSPGHCSALGPLAGLECDGQLSQYVHCWVCVPMLGAHRYLPLHGSTLGPLALVGVRWSASRSLCVAGCVCAFVWRIPVLAWSRLDGFASTATSQRLRLPRLQLKIVGPVSTATARGPRLYGHRSTASP